MAHTRAHVCVCRVCVCTVLRWLCLCECVRMHGACAAAVRCASSVWAWGQPPPSLQRRTRANVSERVPNGCLVVWLQRCMPTRVVYYHIAGHICRISTSRMHIGAALPLSVPPLPVLSVGVGVCVCSCVLRCGCGCCRCDDGAGCLGAAVVWRPPVELCIVVLPCHGLSRRHCGKCHTVMGSNVNQPHMGAAVIELPRCTFM